MLDTVEATDEELVDVEEDENSEYNEESILEQIESHKIVKNTYANRKYYPKKEFWVKRDLWMHFPFKEFTKDYYNYINE